MQYKFKHVKKAKFCFDYTSVFEETFFPLASMFNQQGVKFTALTPGFSSYAYPQLRESIETLISLSEYLEPAHETNLRTFTKIKPTHSLDSEEPWAGL